MDIKNVTETISMIEEQNFDIRTITIGISLLDCIDPDINKACDKIYTKITTKAKNLVQVGNEISAELGIPIVNKRVSVTPISIIGAATDASDYTMIAKTLDKAAIEVGIDFIGGFSALVQKGYQTGDKILIDSIPQALAQTTKVCASDEVSLDNRVLKPEQTLRYVLLNKPAGYVCSMADEQGRQTAASLLQPFFKERLYNVGRLDMFSSGLIIFTNDGQFAKKLQHPSSLIEKEYIVKTSVPFPRELAQRFEKGIRIDGVFYKCRCAQPLSARSMRIVLVEGKNREIRRVFDFFETGIRSLERVRIGSICIDGLACGAFRELTDAELHLFEENYGYSD